MNLKLLRIAGPAVFLIGVLIWMMGGARAGFTNTSIEHARVDEITGLEFTEYEDGLIPGIEFLAVGFLGFGALAVTAAFLENRREP